MKKIKRKWKDFKYENPKTAKVIKYGAIATGTVVGATAIGVAVGTGVGAAVAATSGAVPAIGVAAGTVIPLIEGLTIGGAIGGGTALVGGTAGAVQRITKLKSIDKAKDNLEHLVFSSEFKINPQPGSSQQSINNPYFNTEFESDEKEDLVLEDNLDRGEETYYNTGQNSGSSSQSIDSPKKEEKSEQNQQKTQTQKQEENIYELSFS